MEKHNHCVKDSVLRSFLVVFTGNALEYIADFFFLHYVMGKPIADSFEGSVGIVAICYITTFIGLRIWGRVSWGRQVKDIAK
jgi:hypothetical protein